MRGPPNGSGKRGEQNVGLRFRRHLIIAAVLSLAGPAAASGIDRTLDPFGYCADTPISEMTRREITICNGLDHFLRTAREESEREAAHPSPRLTPEESCFAMLPKLRQGCDKKFEAQARDQVEDDIRSGRGVNLCPPPMHMTEDGCQSARR